MKSRITDHEAELLLTGRIPQGRPDLGELAASVATFRSVAFQTVPQPTAALADRLGLSEEALAAAMPPFAADSTDRGPVTAPDLERRHAGILSGMGTRLAGLGLAAKIAAGVGALALGVTVTGAAGALPGVVQEAFDEIVSAVIAVEDGSEGGSGVVVIDDPSSVEDILTPTPRDTPVDEDDVVVPDEVISPPRGDAVIAPESDDEHQDEVEIDRGDIADPTEYESGSATPDSDSGQVSEQDSADTYPSPAGPAEGADPAPGVEQESDESFGGGVRGP